MVDIYEATAEGLRAGLLTPPEVPGGLPQVTMVGFLFSVGQYAHEQPEGTSADMFLEFMEAATSGKFPAKHRQRLAEYFAIGGNPIEDGKFLTLLCFAVQCIGVVNFSRIAAIESI